MPGGFDVAISDGFDRNTHYALRTFYTGNKKTAGAALVGLLELNRNDTLLSLVAASITLSGPSCRFKASINCDEPPLK